MEQRNGHHSLVSVATTNCPATVPMLAVQEAQPPAPALAGVFAIAGYQPGQPVRFVSVWSHSELKLTEDREEALPFTSLGKLRHWIVDQPVQVRSRLSLSFTDTAKVPRGDVVFTLVSLRSRGEPGMLPGPDFDAALAAARDGLRMGAMRDAKSEVGKKKPGQAVAGA